MPCPNAEKPLQAIERLLGLFHEMIQNTEMIVEFFAYKKEIRKKQRIPPPVSHHIVVRQQTEVGQWFRKIRGDLFFTGSVYKNRDAGIIRFISFSARIPALTRHTSPRCR